MKLYTEEQLIEALKSGYLNFFDDTNRLNLFAHEYTSKLTPVELPSDEEIEKGLFHQSNEYAYGYKDAFKWMRDKIKQKVLLKEVMEADEKDGLYDKNK